MVASHAILEAYASRLRVAAGCFVIAPTDKSFYSEINLHRICASIGKNIHDVRAESRKEDGDASGL